MDQHARWIRLEAAALSVDSAACRAFVRSQGERGAPVCLWGRAEESVRLDEGLWADEGQHAFVLLVPTLHAPGRRDRWLSWGLSPVVAALRRFEARAYLDGSAVCLHGSRIGGGSAHAIGQSAAIFGVFPGEPPRSFDEAGRGKLLEVDPWLSALNREGRARQMLAAFRSALELQHGWQFDTGWPSEVELSAMTPETLP